MADPINSGQVKYKISLGPPKGAPKQRGLWGVRVMWNRNLRPTVDHNGIVRASVRKMDIIAWNIVATEKHMSSYEKESQKTYTLLDYKPMSHNLSTNSLLWKLVLKRKELQSYPTFFYISYISK